MISVQNLSKLYGEFPAVDDVTFRIERGEIVGLLGHNGAGKTTIMKMVTGFLEPDQGTISVAGLDISEHRSTIQTKIGYLPENCPVYLEMTVIDYLEYAAGLKGMTGADRISGVRYAIEKTELAEKATQTINTLSRGYRQRVGVAQSILNQPEVLILDEPTNGLDPSQILHMRDLITELSKQSTVIISTHILQEVQVLCNRVLILRDGRMALDSTIKDLNQGQKLFLTIDKGPDEAKPELNSIPGVQSVELLSKNFAEYNYALDLAPETSQDVREYIPSISKAVIDQGFSLYAIYLEVRDLETVFNEVNAIDPTLEGETIRAA